MNKTGTAIQEGIFCEGNTHPLESDRTTELAVECWNLRKTIMEQGAHAIKLRKDIKSNKNLVKNLQRCVAELENESLMKTKDIIAKKGKILQLEKKIVELTTTNTVVNSSFARNKKILGTLQDKISTLQKENKGLQEKVVSTAATLRQEMSDQESALCLEIRKVSEDRDKYSKELAVQTSFLDEATARIGELEGITKELTDTNDMQMKQFQEDLATLTQEQEQAYDQLHAKLEHIWQQRDELCRKLVEKEHETHQLMSFILMEGLQLPELTEPKSSQYAAALAKLPNDPPAATAAAAIQQPRNGSAVDSTNQTGISEQRAHGYGDHTDEYADEGEYEYNEYGDDAEDYYEY